MLRELKSIGHRQRNYPPPTRLFIDYSGLENMSIIILKMLKETSYGKIWSLCNNPPLWQILKHTTTYYYDTETYDDTTILKHSVSAINVKIMETSLNGQITHLAQQLQWERTYLICKRKRKHYLVNESLILNARDVQRAKLKKKTGVILCQ